MKSRSDEPRQRMTKDDMAVAAIIQDNIHLSTADLKRKRDLVACELDSVGSEIIELTTRIEQVKLRRNLLLQQVNGITQIIETRK